MGKTHSKPLAARHGTGRAWARHAMCESALNEPFVAMGSRTRSRSLVAANSSATDSDALLLIGTVATDGLVAPLLGKVDM